MKQKIPVTIADKEFPSINQSRLHFTNILHKYQPSQVLTDADKEEITALISAAPSGLGNTPPTQVRVVIGQFARPCFEVESPHSPIPQRISMMRSIRQHIEKTARQTNTPPES